MNSCHFLLNTALLAFMLGEAAAMWLGDGQADCRHDEIYSEHLGTCRPLTAGQCTGAGVWCRDCSTLELCVDGGGPLMVVDHKCDADEVCTVQTNPPTCVKNQACALRDFACKVPGVYPHPTNCSKYFLCLEGNHLVNVECPPGQGYSVNLRACTTIGACSHVPFCVKELQTGIVGDGSVYYVCTYDATTKTLAPDQYTCPSTKKYDPSTYSCK